MADKISELPEVTTLADADLIPVVAGGVTSKIQKSNFAIATGIPAVNTFADLPAAASYTDKIYRVKTTTGAWYTFDKKSSGIYQSNGTIWVLQPGVLSLIDLIDISIASEPAEGTFLRYDDANNVWKASKMLTSITETIAYEELTAAKTISFASADVLYFYINPAGASVALTMPSDPGSLSKSGILWIKNNTSKAHTWVTTPAIRFVSETDADTVPTPAADGYYTRYTCQWHDNNGGTGFWAIGLAGKDTA